MVEPARCTQCGSQNVETGRIRGQGRIVFENTKKFFSFSLGRPTIAVACLDCGHIGLRLKGVATGHTERSPHDIVDLYRKVAATLVTATDQSEIDKCRQALEELRGEWRTQHGADSLHDVAFDTNEGEWRES